MVVVDSGGGGGVSVFHIDRLQGASYVCKPWLQLASNVAAFVDCVLARL